MANQPTKYRKFVVGAASAALVASAVAPVASAKDFSDTKGNTHEPAIDALSDAGIITGYPDGSFQPNKTLTRSDVVKLMGKWLVNAQGYEVPSDYKTNPRFADLTSASNDELLKYAAVVKDNGVFVGTPDGKLDPAGNITRENMAIVLVRAFDRVHNIDLATYVAGQDFKKDVNDRSAAKAEARPAIDVLDFFDITNPAAPAFNPKGTTTRGHFATFLHKSINTDFSDVASGVVGDATVKAVNATTVEVTFKDAVENINSLNFTIEGLTVSNAAVKQTDNKTVVLTTAVQEGGKEYTVSVDNKEIGKFTGVSAVIPTKVTVNTTSVQAKVGQQAILSADVGVKQAGIPVTFNVAASGTLNKDQIFESVTNAEGIATFSYTQYSADADSVSVYPTGAPAVRDFAKVYWGVDNILTITAADKKTDSITNGENKLYTVKYLDPKTGKPVANQRLHVTFAENVDTTINKINNATVNGKTPYQLTNGNKEVVTVTTNSNGEATLTVSGLNTKATPIVFLDDAVNNRVAGNDVLEATELQAKAAELTIGAVQANYVIDVTRDGAEEAATGAQNGREYTISVKTKDGKAAANEIVNVAFNEDIDRNINTNTKAYFTDGDGKDITKDRKITVKLDADGEGTFTIVSTNEKDYATPVVWIDINSSNAHEGNLDEGEPSFVAPITYFAEPKLTGGAVKASKSSTVDPNASSVKDFSGTDTAWFTFSAANQSGNYMPLGNDYKEIDATFTVFNTGNNDVLVEGEYVVSPNRSVTITKKDSKTPQIKVQSGNKSDKDLSTSVRVEASGTAIAADTGNRWNSNRVPNINLGNHSVEAKFTSTKAIGETHTGFVTAINTSKQTITFDGKSAVSYKDASFKNALGNDIQQSTFEKTITDGLKAGKIYEVTRKKDGDKITVSIIDDGTNASSKLVDVALVSSAKTDVTEDTDAKVKAGLKTGDVLKTSVVIGGKTVDVAWESDSDAIAVASNGTITVNAVEEDTAVELTATITRGDAEETATFTVNLSPAEEVPVQKGELLGKIEDAKALETNEDYTAASRAALRTARLNAQAVYDNASATQAQVTSAYNALVKAIDELVEVVAEDETVEVTVAVAEDAGTLTFSFSTAVTAPEVAIGEGSVASNDEGDVAITLADETVDEVTLKVTINGEEFTFVATYDADASTWSVTPAKVDAPKAP